MALYLKKYTTHIKPKTIRKELQLLFLKRLSRLLQNGYTLIEALEVIKWDKNLEKPASNVIEALKNGSSLDQAFDKAKFNPIVTSYLFFVQANGDVYATIEKCIYMFEQRLLYVQKFQQVARYPIILLFVFSILLYFIKQSVLPSFLDLFQANSETSSTVYFSMVIIDFLSSFVVVIIILAIVGGGFWQLHKHKISIHKQIKVYSSIPIYRKYKQIQTSFLFATHFSSLLKTGIPIKEILTIMSQQTKLPILSYYSKLMTAELQKGLQLSSLLSQFQLLEKQVAMIFQKNADINALEKDLSVYAELVTEELHRKIMKVITYIQPAFFLVLAGFIVFIYITLMWPMFQLIKTI
ncbi:competence type IV pilus assembly protein ComGB [Virgibacillus ndiopensis]|uniref:competence type IV pilus assembly protein ComGB n=1 Tax=Virgibacillus ndiopensis TaxID=2004408 RepID=UPI000C084686|nr:competence type IV pilus assembly protein ComGB [Virgibacillus ndiopensis]